MDRSLELVVALTAATVSSNPDPEVITMPDVTKADVLAIIQAVVAVLVAFGLNLTEVQQASILGLATALAVALPLADAKRRSKRVDLAVKQMELQSAPGVDPNLPGYTGPRFG